MCAPVAFVSIQIGFCDMSSDQLSIIHQYQRGTMWPHNQPDTPQLHEEIVLWLEKNGHKCTVRALIDLANQVIPASDKENRLSRAMKRNKSLLLQWFQRHEDRVLAYIRNASRTNDGSQDQYSNTEFWSNQDDNIEYEEN